MKSFTVALLAFTLFANYFSFAQSSYTNIQIGSSGGPEEPSIIINPKNTNQVVAGANIDHFYYSTNAGLTWVGGTLIDNMTVWGDPALTVDTSGNFYYFHLTNGNSFIDRLTVQKSVNGGMTWSNPGSHFSFIPPNQQDKVWPAVDWTNGPRGNWIYATWTQFDSYGTSNQLDTSRILFSRSTDGGITWLAPIRIDQRGGDCVDEDNTVEGAVPCVGPNGQIYVGWAGPLVRNSQFKIFFDKSTDGGNTWLANDIIAATEYGGWDLGPSGSYGVSGIYRANGLPVTCCDISNGPYRGYIYINYLDSAGSHDRDVKVVRSTDGGNTWGTPVRVNDDTPGKEQFFTWLTIDKTTGYLYDVFYDRRNYTDNNTDVYMARSTNGGVTWINERISASSFLPTSGTFFGDYNNITAANGRVRPIWTRLVSGSLSVWTAIIDFPVGISSNQNEIPSDYLLAQNYPNPFNPQTKIKFDIPAGNSAKTFLSVFNVLGKEVAVLVNELKPPGSYEINWDASSMSSGVYFYTIKSGSFTDTKKMLLIK